MSLNINDISGKMKLLNTVHIQGGPIKMKQAFTGYLSLFLKNRLGT